MNFAVARCSAELATLPAHAHVGLVREFCRTKDYEALSVLAARPDLHPDADREISQVKDARVRASWVSSLRRTPRELAEAAGDQRVSVRLAAASHDRCDPATLARLALDSSVSVVHAAAANSRTPTASRALSWARLAIDPAAQRRDHLISWLPAQGIDLAARCLEQAPTLSAAAYAAQCTFPSDAGREVLLSLLIDELASFPREPRRSRQATLLGPLNTVIAALDALAGSLARDTKRDRDVAERVALAVDTCALQGAWRQILLAASAPVTGHLPPRSLLDDLSLLSQSRGADALNQVIAIVARAPHVGISAITVARHPDLPATSLDGVLRVIGGRSARSLAHVPICGMRPSMAAVLVHAFQWCHAQAILRTYDNPEALTVELLRRFGSSVIGDLNAWGALPDALLVGQPTPAVRRAPESVLQRALAWAASELGDSPSAWETFWPLAEEFDGSWQDLVRVARALSGEN